MSAFLFLGVSDQLAEKRGQKRLRPRMGVDRGESSAIRTNQSRIKAFSFALSAFFILRLWRLDLDRFLEYGEIEISNNQVENAIRPFVVGRKGWLFANTVDGAKANAILYSLVETAKANSLNVEDWLTYVLSEMAERQNWIYKDDIYDDLLPWAEEMQKKFRVG